MGILLPATILLSLLSGAQLATKKGEKIIGSTLPRPPPSSFLSSHFPLLPFLVPLPTQLASIIPPLLPDPQLSQALLLLLLLLLLFLNPRRSQMLLLILTNSPLSLSAPHLSPVTNIFSSSVAQNYSTQHVST